MMRSPVLTVAFLVSGMLMSTVAQGDTIFGTNFDNSKGAGIADGNPVPIVAGASTINSASSKFGAGSLDTTTVFSGGNGLRYDTADNFNPLAGTIDFWIQMPNGYNGVRQDLFSIFEGVFDGDFSLYIDPNGARLAAVVDVNNANQWVQFGFSSAFGVLGDTDWHHIAWEWDTVAEFSTLYVDGVAESFSVTGAVSFDGGTLGSEMEIGSRQGGFDAFQGNIDDLRIHDTAIYNQVSSFTPPTQSAIPDFGLPGDFNADGAVNSADYAIWLANLGSATSLPNDNGLGSPVALAHYDLWKNGIGSAGTGSGAGVAVPEPATGGVLILLGVMAMCFPRCEIVRVFSL